MSTVYQWKPGAPHKADAQKVGERIEVLRRKHGGFVTPELLVQEARAKASPLHVEFEWNDAKAADAHRLDQARYVLRTIVTTVEVIDREPAVVRAFVSVQPDEDMADDLEAGYTSLNHALSQPKLRAQVVHQARMEFQALRRKYSELTELADVFRAIDIIREP